MKNKFTKLFTALLFFCILSCTKPAPPVSPAPDNFPDFVEAVPETIVFTNAQFIYNGDDMGEEISDGWVIKFYTDMEIDETGSPIGPGCVVQLLLNVRYDPEQSADPKLLRGRYTQMMNSGDFSAGTFVDGYMARIDLPTGTVEMADATFYADIAAGETEMDYDLLDEGVVAVSINDDGTITIDGILVGKKYTKRYFTWTGTPEPRNEAPEEIPNSTIENDLTDLTFPKGQIQDRGDCFFLRDESYRCLLIYLAEEDVVMTQYRPTGSGAVLRLELLVPWNVNIHTDGIPEGSYPMIERNENGSIDREKIVPGGALTGLPDVFAAWELSGSWYYELNAGSWNGTYARINGGTVTIEKGEDGTHTVSYDLVDCQNLPKKITGSTTVILETV